MPVKYGRGKRARFWAAMVLIAPTLVIVPVVATAQINASPAYREFPIIGSRLAIWLVAQMHLLLAAFVLGVPIFALICEYIGYRTKDLRYDRLARDFTKLLVTVFSITAIFGSVLLLLLIQLYPNFFNYLTSIFYRSMGIYALLFFFEAFSFYLYWYTWDFLMDRKRLHLTIGLLLNVFGTVLMFIANSWATFMMSPAGIDEGGNLISAWSALTNITWMPLNIHRLIANIAYGGSVAAAYAAFKFLVAKDQEERAHFDWMGYTGNFVAISALMVLPFAGYWFGREIYAFNQQMGITLMGGFLSWLWIIQAVLIGVLFMGSNYYLWLGMERIPGAERFRKYIKYMVTVLGIGFIVWATPHSLVASLEEARRIGGAHHPLLGVLGVMSAKNTAVNLMILTTFLSFLLYRRGNKEPVVRWARAGHNVQWTIFGVAAGVVLFYGIYGYYVEAIVRIGFSVYQVMAVMLTIVSVTIIDLLLYRGALVVGTINWGKIPDRAQYTLMVLAITFTWLMCLMGFARSAIRQHWHVYGIMRDTSIDAYTPPLGYAANVISITVIIFFLFILFVFWLGQLGEKIAVPKVVPAAESGASSNPGNPQQPVVEK